MAKKEKVQETPEVEAGKTVVRPDTTNYQKAKAASGATTQHNGDPVACAVEGATLDEVYGLAAEVLETPVADLQAKYDHLNGGMQRMNLGNRIRGVVNRLNKEAEGSGDSYITEVSSGIRQAVEERAAAAAQAAAAKAKETPAEEPAGAKEKSGKRSKKAA